MTNIREIIINYNPWWKGELLFKYHERDIYKKINKFLKLPQMISFTGLRRIGKTTLMKKIIEDYISENFDAENILYFSFDEFRNIEIRDILKEYEIIMNKDLNRGKYLLLLDEIQKLDSWENKLKSIYDIYIGKIKIIISGSESLFIKKKSMETLAGRIFDFKIFPLSFPEFLNFKKIKYQPVKLYEKELIILFNEFIQMQGFPELVGIKDKEIIKKYIEESILGRIIFKDIPLLFNIKNISLLETLFRIIHDESGQLIEMTEISKELKFSRQTISKYLKYLEESFLINKLYNYSKKKRKTERKLKKYYPAIISVNLTFKNDNLSKSNVFEWIVVNQLRAEYFYRDSYKNEVDIIIGEEIPIPIEVKFGKISYRGLLSFMKKFNVENGYIISNQVEMEKTINNKKIKIIPAYKFLLRNNLFY